MEKNTDYEINTLSTDIEELIDQFCEENPDIPVIFVNDNSQLYLKMEKITSKNTRRK